MTERIEYGRDDLTTSDVAGDGQREPARGESRPGSETDLTPLFSSDDTERLWDRWDAIQTGFVDEPRRSVEQADHLVAESIKHLAEMFAAERENLERQWDRGDDVSTEELRIAMRRYRSFFGRILSV